MALTDMSYWTNGLGHAGSGAPTSSDDLVFDKAKSARLRFNANKTGAFRFNSLQIGTAWQSTVVVHDGGDIHFANPENGGLKFSYGSWYMNFNGSVSFNCDVAILSNDAEKPFVMHVGQEQYSNSTLNITGKLKGSADACLVLGPWPRKYGDSTTLFCARNSTFNLNDISEYAGIIMVTSMYDHVTAADENHGYGTRLRLNTGSTTSSAKIHLSRGGSLSLKAFGDTVTSFIAGTQGKGVITAWDKQTWYKPKGRNS